MPDRERTPRAKTKFQRGERQFPTSYGRKKRAITANEPKYKPTRQGEPTVVDAFDPSSLPPKERQRYNWLAKNKGPGAAREFVENGVKPYMGGGGKRRVQNKAFGSPIPQGQNSEGPGGIAGDWNQNAPRGPMPTPDPNPNLPQGTPFVGPGGKTWDSKEQYQDWYNQRQGQTGQVPGLTTGGTKLEGGPATGAPVGVPGRPLNPGVDTGGIVNGQGPGGGISGGMINTTPNGATAQFPRGQYPVTQQGIPGQPTGQTANIPPPTQVPQGIPGQHPALQNVQNALQDPNTNWGGPRWQAWYDKMVGGQGQGMKNLQQAGLWDKFQAGILGARGGTQTPPIYQQPNQQRGGPSSGPIFAGQGTQTPPIYQQPNQQPEVDVNKLMSAF